ncbi:MAG: CRISPR-associated endonuclease Cas3'' [Syntrophaceae bacterium]|jgi:CRISPR-associated endonuclease/helicase Cas3|nr:CRISPR-associated endonuclease Cas3'' [Syntrophaceae bacterium]
MYLAHSAKGNIPEQSYQEHVCNVHKMALSNAERAGAYSRYGTCMKDAVALAALYHDLGKLAPENQNVLKGRSRSSLPLNHVDAGVAALQSRGLSLAENLAALFVYSHHIGLQSLPDENAKGKGNVFRDISLNQEGKSVKEIIDKSLRDYLDVHKSFLTELTEMQETERSVIAPTPLFMRMSLSCLVDADHTDTARHYNNVIPDGEIQLQPEKRLTLLDNYVSKLAEKNKRKKVSQREQERNKLRQQIYDVCRNALPSDKGMITCDSPVGTGKTTAIMAHLLSVAKAKCLRRVFVVLPFTNIIDQSVDIYRDALVLDGENREKVIAAHHHKAEFEDLGTRAFSFLWNAPITVTTAVQFFETLASNHPASLRKLHQIAGSAIFIDEAHAALPASLWAQAWKWLQELVKDWGCYIVLASGSLNRFWELEEFSDPPSEGIPELVQDNVREMAMKVETMRVNYPERQKKPLNIDELCAWIREMQGPRLLILNTVHSAAAAAKRLYELHGNKKYVEHLSTSLAPIHRSEILKRVKQRLKTHGDNDWTLVATSCVEAGIDFSFRTAAREFCSLASTIQTAGRVNRSGEYAESALYGFQIFTDGYLKEHPAFKTSAKLLKQLYDEKKIAPEFCTEAMRREVREKNQVSANSNPIIIAERKKDFPSVEEQFKIITSNTVTAIIDKELREKIERHEKVSFVELQQKSVAIYSNKIDEYALKPLKGFNDLYAWMLEYDSVFLGYMAGVLKMTNDPNNYFA